MKKISLFLIITLSIFSLTAQNSLKVNITSKYGEILYIGVDNKISVSSENIEKKDMKFTITHGTIRRTSDGKIIVNVRKRGKSTLKAFYNNKMIGSKEFNCLGVPDPSTALMVGEKIYRYGEINKAELLKAEKLIAYMGPNFESRFVVTKFILTAKKGGTSASAISNTENFTEVQKEILAKAGKGSKIYFEDISCIGPDGSKRFLPVLVLTVK